MTAVSYTAKRSIIVGHTIDNVYSLDLACLDIVPERRPRSEVAEAMAGIRETLRYHAVRRFAVSLAQIKDAQLAAVLEFLDSVESGESFTFDPYGSVSTPVAPTLAELEEGGYAMQRRARGQGGANDYYAIQFTVRVLLT